MVEDDLQAMTVRLPRPLYEWLRRTAFERHVSMSQIIIAAIEHEKTEQEKNQSGSTS